MGRGTERRKPDRHREVVAEGLSDGAGVQRGAEAGDLRVLYRVTVLVHDHLTVLRIVDAALAQADLVLGAVGEGVVDAVLIDPDVLGLLVHGRQLAGPEPERLDVLLRLRDPEVGHDLLEAVVVAGVVEVAVGGVGERTGRALHVGPVADEVAGAVEVGEGTRHVGTRGDSAVGVLLIGERLVTGGLHRVDGEDSPGGAGRRVHRCG
ncbi:MAG: hypothetical protein ACXV2G_11225 [Actinomycetes bacterium]